MVTSMRAARWLLLASVLTACGSSVTRSETAHEPRANDPPSAHVEEGAEVEQRGSEPSGASEMEWPSQAANIPPGWHAELFPLGRLSMHQRVSDGLMWILAGGFRVQIAASGSHVAPVRFATSILGAAPVEDGWVFLTEDGTVWRADGFLDDPRAIGIVPGASSLSGNQRAAITTRTGEVWATDGRGLTLLTLSTERRALGAVFLSASRLVVLLDNRTALESVDAGATFHALETALPASEHWAGAGLFFEPSGSIDVAVPSPARWLWGTIGVLPMLSGHWNDVDHFVRSVLIEHSPALSDFVEDECFRDFEGTRFCRTDEAWTMQTPGAVPVQIRGLPHRCRIDSDIDSEFPRVLFYREQGRRVELWTVRGQRGHRIGSMDSDGYRNRIVLSDDGTHLIDLSAGCDDPEELDDEAHQIRLCVTELRTGRRSTRVVPMPRGAGTEGDSCIDVDEDDSCIDVDEYSNGPFYIGAYRGTLLVSSPETSTLVSLVRPDGIRSIPKPARIESAVIHDLRVLPDGIFSANAVLPSNDTEPSRVLGVLGDFQGRIRLIDLPEGATAVGFMNARRGVAVGRDLRAVWVTDDGGANFLPVTLALEGAPESVPLVEPRSDTAWENDEDAVPADAVPAVVCRSRGCVFNSRLWVGDASSAGRPHRVLAAPRP